jgi:hypothetical protein
VGCANEPPLLVNPRGLKLSLSTEGPPRYCGFDAALMYFASVSFLLNGPRLNLTPLALSSLSPMAWTTSMSIGLSLILAISATTRAQLKERVFRRAIFGSRLTAENADAMAWPINGAPRRTSLQPGATRFERRRPGLEPDELGKGGFGQQRRQESCGIRVEIDVVADADWGCCHDTISKLARSRGPQS